MPIMAMHLIGRVKTSKVGHKRLVPAGEAGNTFFLVVPSIWDESDILRVKSDII